MLLDDSGTLSSMIYVGTSGFSYKEWKGEFYPEKLPAAEYLSHYATQFNTTEINNTFYRIPNQKMTAGWAGKVPGDFRLSLKLSQRITHRKRLRDVDEEMGWFLNGALPLSAHLGCLLVQLPPNFKQDLELLETFLTGYASKVRLALEFRHESWLSTNTYDLLRRFGAALAVVESETLEAIREVTAQFIYVRLRREDYSPAELTGWAEWIASREEDVFVYLKHAEQAPVRAFQLKSALAELSD